MPAEKWKRVTDAIRTSITTGDWTPGQRLPLTSELAATFSTSRATIAHALSQLGREGWITYISRNAGWQVATAKRRRRMSRNRMTSAERAAGRGGFLTDAAQVNRPAVVRTEVANVEPPADVAALLELEPGDRTVRRHRLMYLGDHPAQVATGYLPADIAAGTAIEQENPGHGGIIARLADLGHAITGHVERILPLRPGTGAELEALGIPPGEGVCQLTRVSFSGDRPVLVELIVMPPTEVELVYDLPAE